MGNEAPGLEKFKGQTSPPSISSNIIFRKNFLQYPHRREKIKKLLQNVSWEMTVTRYFSDRGYGFLKHDQFPEDIFIQANNIPEGLNINKNDMVKAKVFIERQDHKNIWTYKGIVLSKLSEQQHTKQHTEIEKMSSKKPRKVLKQYAHKGKGISSDKALIQNLGRQNLAVPSVRAFARDIDYISIYIDEAWPGSVSTDQSSARGVIGGIIWKGFQPDYRALNWINTHLRTSPEGIEALRKLMGCHRAMPFVMPIDATMKYAEHQYFELLVCAIKILLGWLLPQTGNSCKVRILCEAYQNFPVDTDRTQHLKAVFAEAKQINPIRFSRWNLEVLRWADKRDEYVPYADLVAHLSLEHHAWNQTVGKLANYRQWPGYVPLSLGLIPTLNQLDHVHNTGNVADILDFIATMDGTELCKIVLKDLKPLIAGRPDLQKELLETLESRYQQKSRDLKALRRQTSMVKNLVELPTRHTPLRQTLLWHLIDLQRANHDGDPEGGGKAAEEYLALRARVVEHDRELVAYADLNVAVHLNDQFRFEEALTLSEGMATDEDERLLSSLAYGRSLSSLGQIYSMTGSHAAAEQCFKKALSRIESAVSYESRVADDLDQTRVYRAINAMDGKFDNTVELVENVIGRLAPQTIDRFAEGDTHKNPYHHHLLVRGLWYLEPLNSFSQTYINRISHWQTGPYYHPWELINCYRALLLWDMDDDTYQDNSREYFKAAIQMCQRDPHGATLKMIGAAIATAAWCCYDDIYFSEEAIKLLNILEKTMPAVLDRIARLRKILSEPRPEAIDEALSVLPFNYR